MECNTAICSPTPNTSASLLFDSELNLILLTISPGDTKACTLPSLAPPRKKVELHSISGQKIFPTFR